MTVLTPALLNLLRSRLDQAAATDTAETKRNNSLNLAPSTFLKGCKKLLHYHPFKPREIQRLYDGDHQVLTMVNKKEDIYSRMDVTVHPSLSVCPFVCQWIGLSVSPSHFYFFLSYSFLLVILSH